MDIKKNAEIYWDNFVDGYSQVQQNPLIFGMQLINFMKLNNAEYILDAGCGPGMMIPHLIMRKSKEAKLISIDLSEKILEAAQQTVKSYFSNIDHQLNWTCQKEDVEQLSLPNDTFDRYYCNQVLHLVPDPQQALKEAHRVLKPGGVLGFAVWGRREYSDFFTVPSDCMKEAGYQMPNNHDLFALGQNKKYLQQLLEEIGFRNLTIWYSTIAYDVQTLEEYLSYQNPANQALINAEPDKKEKFLKLYQQRIDEKRQQKEPFYHECLSIVCYK